MALPAPSPCRIALFQSYRFFLPYLRSRSTCSAGRAGSATAALTWAGTALLELVAASVPTLRQTETIPVSAVFTDAPSQTRISGRIATVRAAYELKCDSNRIRELSECKLRNVEHAYWSLGANYWIRPVRHSLSREGRPIAEARCGSPVGADMPRRPSADYG